MTKRGHVKVPRSAIQHGTSWWYVLLTVLVLLGRFLVGSSMDGRRRTNATFWARGTEVTQGLPDWFGPTAPTRWSYWPGWVRAALRWATVGLVVAWLVWPHTVTIAAVGALAAAVGYRCDAAYTRLRNRKHRRDVVRPAYLALAQYLGTPTTDDPERWLYVPADSATDPEAVIALALPEGFDAAEGVRQALDGVIDRRFRGVWEPAWTTDVVTWRHAPQPPDKVTYADIYNAAAASPEHLVPIGITAGGGVKKIDVDGDAPHIAFSGGTGAGKSTFLRWTGAYLVNKGAEEVTIIDPKRISLRKPFKGVPNVRIYKALEDQKAAMADFRREMEARYLWAESQEDEEEALDSLRRRVLIIEEGGTFFQRVRDDWANTKERGDPAEPPTITNYREIMFMSRGAKCTVILVVQSGNAKDMGASGGTSSMRDQFAAKVLVRFSANVWSMLVGSRPIPRAPKHRGRGYVVLGDEQDLVQLVNPSSDECRSFALEGDPEAPAPRRASAPVAPSPQRVLAGDDQGDVTGTATASADERICASTHADAPRAGLAVVTRQYDMGEVLEILGCNYAAFKQWRQRAKKRGEKVPDPTYVRNRPLYDEDQVDELKMLRDKSA